MKLTYWYSKCPDDSDVYSVRTRTKKEAKRLVDTMNAERSHSKWPDPRKVTVEYRDSFDLMESCSMEDHHWWEV